MSLVLDKDDYLSRVYVGSLSDVLKTPRSEVFYARAAVESAVGVRLSLEHLTQLMKEELNFAD